LFIFLSFKSSIMRYTTALALAGTAGLAAAHPAQQPSSHGVATFPAGSSWDILLNNGDAKISASEMASGKYSVIDIDLFDTDKATITELKKTKKVICYFSAGSREDWRADADRFGNGDVGQALGDWKGENWLNVKSANVRAIMKQRIQQAADKGCNAVDPDNIDGHNENQDGFGYDKSAYVDYVKYMASEAKKVGLAIGLKNGIEMIGDLVGVVQFAVNEQCHQYNECDKYKPFTTANKAVFQIEYGSANEPCTSPKGVKLSTLVKNEDQGLNALGGACSK
jgi:hypothetical protein